jgi:hypothetical protein
MRELSDRQLWAWIAGEAAADRLASVPSTTLRGRWLFGLRHLAKLRN